MKLRNAIASPRITTIGGNPAIYKWESAHISRARNFRTAYR